MQAINVTCFLTWSNLYRRHNSGEHGLCNSIFYTKSIGTEYWQSTKLLFKNSTKYQNSQDFFAKYLYRRYFQSTDRPPLGRPNVIVCFQYKKLYWRKHEINLFVHKEQIILNFEKSFANEEWKLTSQVESYFIFFMKRNYSKVNIIGGWIY